jgi:uncharacterized damage-inducible protein DinB
MKKNKKTHMLAFAVFAFFVLGTPSMAQTTMEEFMAKWENGKQFTLEVVDKMPDDLLDYKPEVEAMSFKEQVTHFSSTIVRISKGFLLGAEPGFASDAKPQSKEELKAFVTACFDYGKSTFSKLTEAQLSEQIDSFAGKVTRRQMVGLVDDHATHHRGAAISYIRANGITPPAFRGL